jgi:hypothetical protein
VGRPQSWNAYRKRLLLTTNGAIDLLPEPIEPRKRQRILDLKQEWEKRLETLTHWAPDKDHAQAKAAATLLRLLFDSGCADSLLSLDELVGLTDAVQRSNAVIERIARGRRKSKKPSDSRSLDAVLWQVVSMEHALVYLKATQTSEIAGVAAQVAAGRSRPGGAILRALEMYRIFLTANLRGRGIDPERVVQFRSTRLRPMNPILPPNMRMEDMASVEWADLDAEDTTKPVVIQRDRLRTKVSQTAKPRSDDVSFLAAPPRTAATEGPSSVPEAAVPPSTDPPAG